MTLDDCSAHLVNSVDSANEFMRWLSTHAGRDAEIALDTEATGLSPETDRVRLVQFGDARTGWAIPFERWGGVVEDALARYEGQLNMHNAGYDVGMLRAEGVAIDTTRVHDTRLMLHVLDGTSSLALKNAATRLVDSRAAHMQTKLDEALGKHGGWTWATVPIDYEPYWAYGALDCVITQQLKDVIWPQVQADAPRSYELELAVSWVVERMERNGVRIDRGYTQRLRDEQLAYADRVAAWCKTHYGVENVGSNPQVVQALRRVGVELTELTKGGLKASREGRRLTDSQYCVDKNVLAGIDHDLARGIVGYRQATRLVGTYLDTYLKLSEGDQRIHPSINSVGGTSKTMYESGGDRGVRTGRMSSSDPNEQNVPIRTPVGKAIRNTHVAEGVERGDPDANEWVRFDFDQIEMRLFAHLNEDPNMTRAFLEPGDFFVNMSKEIFDDPHFQKDDPRRQPVKNASYSWLYGAGHGQFAKTAGMRLPDGSPDVARASAFMARINALYPGAGAYIRATEREAQRHLEDEGVAYVRSPLTNRRHVANDARGLFVLTNYKIQGGAGELLKMKIVEADQAGLGEFMTLPVHDEVDLDVPRDRLADVLVTLRDVANDDKLLRVPITATIEHGPRWGTLTEAVYEGAVA